MLKLPTDCISFLLINIKDCNEVLYNPFSFNLISWYRFSYIDEVYLLNNCPQAVVMTTKESNKSTIKYLYLIDIKLSKVINSMYISTNRYTYISSIDDHNYIWLINPVCCIHHKDLIPKL